MYQSSLGKGQEACSLSSSYIQASVSDSATPSSWPVWKPLPITFPAGRIFLLLLGFPVDLFWLSSISGLSVPSHLLFFSRCESVHLSRPCTARLITYNIWCFLTHRPTTSYFFSRLWWLGFSYHYLHVHVILCYLFSFSFFFSAMTFNSVTTLNYM